MEFDDRLEFGVAVIGIGRRTQHVGPFRHRARGRLFGIARKHVPSAAFRVVELEDHREIFDAAQLIVGGVAVLLLPEEVLRDNELRQCRAVLLCGDVGKLPAEGLEAGIMARLRRIDRHDFILLRRGDGCRGVFGRGVRRLCLLRRGIGALRRGQKYSAAADRGSKDNYGKASHERLRKKFRPIRNRAIAADPGLGGPVPAVQGGINKKVMSRQMAQVKGAGQPRVRSAREASRRTPIAAKPLDASREEMTKSTVVMGADSPADSSAPSVGATTPARAMPIEIMVAAMMMQIASVAVMIQCTQVPFWASSRTP